MKTIAIMTMMGLAMVSCQQQQVQTEGQAPVKILPVK